MIITKLMGGLGNQMFQYALGLQLSVKNKSSLYLDTADLLNWNVNSNQTQREFQLDIFNVSARIKKPLNSSGVFARIYNKTFPTCYIMEESFLYNPAVLELKGNVHLSGFWQNEKYFKHIEALVRKHFSFKELPDKNNLQLLHAIQSTNSISVHFRRGDFITNANAASYHGVCSEDYYKKAIDFTAAKIDDPHYYIFSDDISWVKQNITFIYNHIYVDVNTGRKSYEDLRLMSECKHNIIANSSFSWWGAWLNSNIDKIVIAPDQWYVSQSNEVVPPQWIRM